MKKWICVYIYIYIAICLVKSVSNMRSALFSISKLDMDPHASTPRNWTFDSNGYLKNPKDLKLNALISRISQVFIKLFLGVIYFAGAVSKVVVAGVFGRPWLGSTMQAYIVDAMWSRPHWSCLVRALQRFLLQRWYLCTILAVCGTRSVVLLCLTSYL